MKFGADIRSGAYLNLNSAESRPLRFSLALLRMVRIFIKPAPGSRHNDRIYHRQANLNGSKTTIAGHIRIDGIRLMLPTFTFSLAENVSLFTNGRIEHPAVISMLHNGPGCCSGAQHNLCRKSV
jgi:hypothetical protein